MNLTEQTDGRALLSDLDAGLLSLAMGFVPAQRWENPYDPALALQRGTIFPGLDKPFLGEEAVCRDGKA